MFRIILLSMLSAIILLLGNPLSNDYITVLAAVLFLITSRLVIGAWMWACRPEASWWWLLLDTPRFIFLIAISGIFIVVPRIIILLATGNASMIGAHVIWAYFRTGLRPWSATAAHYAQHIYLDTPAIVIHGFVLRDFDLRVLSIFCSTIGIVSALLWPPKFGVINWPLTRLLILLDDALHARPGHLDPVHIRGAQRIHTPGSPTTNKPLPPWEKAP